MSLLRADLILTLASVALGLIFPRLGASVFEYVESRLARLAKRRFTACVAVALLALSLRLALLPVLPIPEPAIHDEFSYLLAADTYAKGRLTNPTHPMWVHFETFHVNHHPTYVSMYPPAQGLVLAAGKVFLGHPWFGVWLMTGLLCGAITWALQGWLPPGWALFGGLLFMARVGLCSYWMNSYYGASVAGVGAALVTGAVGRLLHAPSSRIATITACGALILANSRPYEGFLLGAGAAIVLLGKLLVDRGWRKAFLRRAAIPFALIAIAGAGAMAYYNWRNYGDPLTLPYVTNRATYAVAPVFVWQTARPIPDYRHKVMRDFFVDYELGKFRQATGEHGLAANSLVHSIQFWIFFLYPLLSVALLLGLPWLIADAQVRLAWILFLVPVAGIGASAFFMAHYAAPAIPAFYILMVQSMRLAYARLWPSRGCGLAIVRNLAASAVLLAIISPAHVSGNFVFGPSWHFVFPPLPGRSDVIRHLDSTGGRDLVLVRYGPHHDSFLEWVYNEADIDGSGIVWAREMNATGNDELIRYFNTRQVWLLEPDEIPPRLTPYSDRH